jgi:ElaB/YqjD/DUF883 family membrane-anchored ribosome-binding protein
MAQSTRTSRRHSHRSSANEASIAKGVQGVRTAAARLATDSIGSLRSSASDLLDRGRATAHDTSALIQDRIRDQPVRYLLMAAAAGFVFGALLMRR